MGVWVCLRGAAVAEPRALALVRRPHGVHIHMGTITPPAPSAPPLPIAFLHAGVYKAWVVINGRMHAVPLRIPRSFYVDAAAAPGSAGKGGGLWRGVMA